MIQLFLENKTDSVDSIFGISKEEYEYLLPLIKKEWDEFGKTIANKMLEEDVDINQLVDFTVWIDKYIKHGQNIQQQALLIHVATRDAIKMSEIIVDFIKKDPRLTLKMLLNDTLRQNKQAIKPEL